MNLTPDTRIDFLFLNLDAARLSLLHAWKSAYCFVLGDSHFLCHSYCSLPKKQVNLDPLCRVFSKCVHMCMHVHVCEVHFCMGMCTHACRGQETTSSCIIPQVPPIVFLLRQNHSLNLKLTE